MCAKSGQDTYRFQKVMIKTSFPLVSVCICMYMYVYAGECMYVYVCKNGKNSRHRVFSVKHSARPALKWPHECV